MGNSSSTICNDRLFDMCGEQETDASSGLDIDLNKMHTPLPPYLGSSSSSSPYHLTLRTVASSINNNGDDNQTAFSFDLSCNEEDVTGEKSPKTRSREHKLSQKLKENSKLFGAQDNSSTAEVAPALSPSSIADLNASFDVGAGESCDAENTLPSFTPGLPIHLRITERGFSFSNNVSFDPFVGAGEFRIERGFIDSNNKEGKESFSSFGNGVSIKCGPQFMTLEDMHGKVYAACRSRHTFIPSYIIYGPRPKFWGQQPSSHKFNRASPTPLDQVKLYPWVMVKKAGRKLDDEVTLHMIDDVARDGNFESTPFYRSNHGFFGGALTHTVVTRRCQDDDTVADNNDDNIHKKSKEKKSSPQQHLACCLIIRDPFNYDLYDMTISPGIDPLLIICYFAIHLKMDIEPKLDPD